MVRADRWISVCALLLLSVASAHAATGIQRLAAASVSITDDSGGASGVSLGDGYILTAAHVIRATSGDINITDSNGHVAVADVVGMDAHDDIGLLHIDHVIPSIAIRNRAVMLGEQVMVMGNPYGRQRTLMFGHVSHTSRPLPYWIPGVRDTIQIDLNVQPGASGAALVDSRGRLVGLISAMFSPVRTFFGQSVGVGIGYAVKVRDILPSVKKIIEAWKYPANRDW